MKNVKSGKLNNKNTYSMANSCITYYSLQQNYMGLYDTYDKIRLIAVLSGEINYTFNEKSVNQNNTELLLLPTYSHLSIHTIKPTKLMVIEVNDELIKSVYTNVNEIRSFEEAINYNKMYIAIKYNSILFKSIQYIHNEYIENSKNPYLVELNINRLIYNLLATQYAPYLFSIKARHPMEQVKYYIDRNIKNQIKISKLADIAGMNSSNFSNTFKRHFGTTPINYINITKMKLAEELLKDSTVTEVAFDLGYENVSVFINQFKKVNNITPKQFQLLNL